MLEQLFGILGDLIDGQRRKETCLNNYHYRTKMQRRPETVSCFFKLNAIPMWL